MKHRCPFFSRASRRKHSVVDIVAATAAVLVLLLSACTVNRGARPMAGRGPCAVSTQVDVPARMRDGTVLRADVYRPRMLRPTPVILLRTQYGKSTANPPEKDWFASHCYLVVVQDVRGQGRSEGTFTEFANDQNDGYDSVEWAAALPGSDGKVGMFGSSYGGATQWLAAVTAPPHLVTIVPVNTASDYYDGWTYEGGEFRLAFVLPWAISTIAKTAAMNRHDDATVRELKDAAANSTRWLNFRPYKDLPPLQPDHPAVAPWYFDWIRHGIRDDYWKPWSIRDHYVAVKIPVLDIEGWYDSFLAGGIENFSGMVAHGGTPDARRDQRLVIGPWDHVYQGSGDTEAAPILKTIGGVAGSPINQLILSWYDHFLKGRDNGVTNNRPQVNYFLMGANKWKSAAGWPLPEAQWNRYFLSGSGGIATRSGKLSTAAPVAEDAPDSYIYDPAHPVPSLGGHSCCNALSGPQGPYDQIPVEQRSDVLVYSSDPLPSDTEVTGPVELDLWASSSATDTDFTAKLIVVEPDGRAINLNNGILRTAFSDSLAEPQPHTPGQPYEYKISIWPTSYLFRAGDRIRVEISSSDYPQFSPNPNTGKSFGQTADSTPATQAIMHDAAHPSFLMLPVIARGAGGSAEFPIRARD
jgi:uncharacterized protein